MRIHAFRVLLVVLWALSAGRVAVGQPPADDRAADEKKPGNRLNFRLPTLGGKQFWSDQLMLHDWRVQRNVVTGHYRLLDGKNYRRAWGTFEQCRAKLDELKRTENLPPMRGKAVIVLHGLFRSRASMDGIAEYLKKNGDYQVFNVAYATTRGDVGMHAAALARIIENLDGIEEINFVAHSLGNLVVRHYLADTTDPRTGRYKDRRIGRIVMLGPPNSGTKMAEIWQGNGLYEFIVGETGKQLAGNWAKFEKKLATPTGDFGIIAGGKGKNPLLGGRDDFVVSVAETRLPGARDFIVLPVIHSFIMQDKTVRECTLRFLKHGHFVSEAKRQPIPKRAGRGE